MSSLPKLLLVDDREENLSTLEALLEGVNAELVRAHSGREALEYSLVDEFAAILLDVHMPLMDGFETAQLLRLRAKNRRAPIIFLTAVHQDADFRARGFAAGASDYLTKPYDPKELLFKVHRYLEAHEERMLERKDATDAQEEMGRLMTTVSHGVERAERVDEMLAFISYDLLRPVQRLSTFTERAMTSMTSGHLDRAEEEMLQNLRRLKGMERRLGAILQYMSEGESLASLRVFDPTLIAQRLQSEFESDLNAAGISLRVDPMEQIYGDPELLGRVFLLLIENVLHHGPAFGCQNAWIRSLKGGSTIEIGGDGKSLRPELEERIFIPLFRENRAEEGHHGIGLALVRRFLEAMGGTVEYHESEGGGIAFHLNCQPVPAPLEVS